MNRKNKGGKKAQKFKPVQPQKEGPKNIDFIVKIFDSNKGSFTHTYLYFFNSVFFYVSLLLFYRSKAIRFHQGTALRSG